jgi:radical SAM superfamily enzyme YgiQ (UPF0313 family)
MNGNSSRNEKLIVGLVQINESLNWSRQRHKGRKKEVDGSSFNYSVFPYSVGMLQAYAESIPHIRDRYEFLTPIYRKVNVEKAAIFMRNAHIAGFSTYVWNINLSLEIAKALKKANPETLIVFGGPQVPDHCEEFLRQYPFIDLCCHGEGEKVFADILVNFENRAWENIGSISYLDKDSRFVSNPRISRSAELESLPSPYLSGTFDNLVVSNPNDQWILLWETNRGCPFSCSFCDWGSAVGTKVYKFGMDRLKAELDWFTDIHGSMIFCCDANFGMLDRDYDLAAYAVALKNLKGFPHSLSVQNTKNSTEKAYKVQQLLALANMNPTVTLSFQSMNEKTLVNIKRKNIDLGAFHELQKRYTKNRIDTYSDVILALPGETSESFAEGVSTLIDGGQHNRILFYNLSILPNSEMGNIQYRQKFQIEYVPQQIISIHSPVQVHSEVPEYLNTVINTYSMPGEDWVRSKAFWWVTDMVYFSKLLQVAFVVIRKIYGLSYSRLLSAFFNAEGFPLIQSIIHLFRDKAIDVRKGDCEYFAGEELLGIYWPADQYALIMLAKENKVDQFYDESRQLILQLLEENQIEYDPDLVDELWAFNQAIIQFPFQHGSLELQLNYNIWEYYTGVLCGEIPLLKKGVYCHKVDRSGSFETLEEWYEHLVLCVNQKKFHLYPHKAMEWQAVSS